jgi:transcriptional regulator with XRE-family HTH domain
MSELAKEANLSQSYLSQIENGKLDNVPSLDAIFSLSETLGLGFLDLAGKAGYVPSHATTKTELPTKNMAKLLFQMSIGMGIIRQEMSAR